jgi:hypothetical protein
MMATAADDVDRKCAANCLRRCAYKVALDMVMAVKYVLMDGCDACFKTSLKAKQRFH